MPLVHQEDTDECKKTLTIQVDEKDLNEQEEEIYKELKDHAEVPGFRKGRATPTVLRWRFGDLVKEESRQKAMAGELGKVVEELGIRVFGEPNIHDVETDKEKPLSFRVDVQYVPKIELAEYEGTSLPVLRVDVTDENVGDTLENLRRRAAPLSPVENRQSQEGDIVRANIEASSEGRNLPALSGQNLHIEIGGEVLLTELNENLRGKSQGDVVELDQTLAESFPAEDLRGKTVHLKVTVNQILERNLPELDDAFAKDLGHETLEALRVAVRGDLEAQAEVERHNRTSLAIQKWLLDHHEFPIPPILLEKSEGETEEEDTEELDETQKEQLESSRRERTADQMRLLILLQEVAKKEEISVSEEELEDFIEARALRLGQNLNRFRIFLDNHRDMLDSYRHNLLERKVMERLAEKINVEWTDKMPGAAEEEKDPAIEGKSGEESREE